MNHTMKNANPFAEQRKSRKTWIAIGLCALGIAIGIVMRLMASSDLGFISAILSGLKAIVIAIWNMLRDVAHACAGFWDYVRGVRQ